MCYLVPKPPQRKQEPICLLRRLAHNPQITIQQTHGDKLMVADFATWSNAGLRELINDLDNTNSSQAKANRDAALRELSRRFLANNKEDGYIRTPEETEDESQENLD